MDLDTLADALRRVTVAVASGDNVVGAGLVWAPQWIVTNAHVIQESRVTVQRADGRRVVGLVVAASRDMDLAVLHAPDLDLPAATAGECGSLRVGSLIVAIGHPFGLRGALTTGVVHAIGPITPGGRPWIQADLRLAPGNSGGPLADARGHVLGLNAMIAGGLALAIPVSDVRRFTRVAGVPTP